MIWTPPRTGNAVRRAGVEDGECDRTANCDTHAVFWLRKDTSLLSAFSCLSTDNQSPTVREQESQVYQPAKCPFVRVSEVTPMPRIRKHLLGRNRALRPQKPRHGDVRWNISPRLDTPH